MHQNADGLECCRRGSSAYRKALKVHTFDYLFSDRVHSETIWQNTKISGSLVWESLDPPTNAWFRRQGKGDGFALLEIRKDDIHNHIHEKGEMGESAFHMITERKRDECRMRDC